MYKDKYELNVLVNDNKPVREYFHRDKFWIESKRGTEYSLRLKNHSPKKILAIFSVDGRDVLKGDAAESAESGYIIQPFSTLNVKGYRIDDNNVATFKFEDSKEQPSYASIVENSNVIAAAQDNPSRNNGVIGVRIWEEKETKIVPNWKTEPYKQDFYANLRGFESSLYASGARILGFGSYSGCILSGSYISLTGCMYSGPISGCGTNLIRSSNLLLINQFSEEAAPIEELNQFAYNPLNTVPNFTIGTTWGQKVEDKVVKTKFDKADSFIDLEMFYLERAELINIGIDLGGAKKVFISGLPKAFGDKEEYCQIPANWKGGK